VESYDASIVLTYAVILKMTTKLSTQNLPPFFGFDLIADGFEPGVHCLAFGDVFLATGLATNFEVAFPG